MLSKDQLKAIMKYQLKHFSQDAKEITDDTKHSDILSDDGFGAVNSKRLYKSLIRYTIRLNNCKDKPWPSNWMNLTVAELADKLL